MNIVNYFLSQQPRGIIGEPDVYDRAIELQSGKIDQEIKQLEESLTDWKVAGIKKDIRHSLRGEYVGGTVPVDTIVELAVGDHRNSNEVVIQNLPDLTAQAVEPVEGMAQVQAIIVDHLQYFGAQFYESLRGVGQVVARVSPEILKTLVFGGRNLATMLLVSRPATIQKLLSLVEQIEKIEKEIDSLDAKVGSQGGIFAVGDAGTGIARKREKVAAVKAQVFQALQALTPDDLQLYSSSQLYQRFLGTDEAVVGAESCRNLARARSEVVGGRLNIDQDLQQVESRLNTRRAKKEVALEVARNLAIPIGVYVLNKLRIMGVEVVNATIKEAKDSASRVIERASQSWAGLGKVIPSLEGFDLNVNQDGVIPKVVGVFIGGGFVAFGAYKMGMFQRRARPL